VARAKVVNIAEAKSRLPELVERAAHGEEIVIARNGTPRARLVALPAKRRRAPGRGAPSPFDRTRRCTAVVNL
jgi:prevent-host-death family protein